MQVLKPSQEPIPVASVENPFAVARPHATDLMLQRQTSFRSFNALHAAGNSPFKRQLSLRLSELPSTLQRQQQSEISVFSDSLSNPVAHSNAPSAIKSMGVDNSGLDDFFKDFDEDQNINPSISTSKSDGETLRVFEDYCHCCCWLIESSSEFSSQFLRSKC